MSNKEIKQTVKSTLQWFLPLLFVLTFSTSVLLGGPPDAISTPANTFRTVWGVCNFIISKGYNEIGLGRPTAHNSTLPPFIEMTAPSDVNELADEDEEEEEDGGPSPPQMFIPEKDIFLELAFTCFAFERAMSMEDQCLNPHFPPNFTTVSSPIDGDEDEDDNDDDDDEQLLPLLRKKRMGRRNSIGLGVALSSFTWSVFNHIACSTSPACIVSLVDDKYDPPWAVFERFYCGENGDWSPTSNRDRFDYYMGWTPTECWADF